MRDVIFSVTYPVPGKRQDNTFIQMEDVTSRRRLEVQLRRLQADYGRAACISTLGELATSIAHKAKQPLSAIATYADVASRWLSCEVPDIEKCRELAQRISESARNAGEIIHRIRDMSLTQVPKFGPVRLPEVVGESILFVRYDADARDVTLITSVPADLPPIWADRVLLQQVLVNLLVNALQAVGPLEPAQRAVSITAAEETPGWVTVRVMDRGQGTGHRTCRPAATLRLILHHQAGRRRPRAGDLPDAHLGARRGDRGRK